MKNLFDAARVEEVKRRSSRLRPDSERQWGKMNAPQALADCSVGLELALGEMRPRRVLLGRILGPIIKPKVFGNDQPLRRNTPTVHEIGRADGRRGECVVFVGAKIPSM